MRDSLCEQQEASKRELAEIDTSIEKQRETRELERNKRIREKQERNSDK